jgi:hypothetical protein
MTTSALWPKVELECRFLFGKEKTPQSTRGAKVVKRKRSIRDPHLGKSKASLMQKCNPRRYSTCVPRTAPGDRAAQLRHAAIMSLGRIPSRSAVASRAANKRGIGQSQSSVHVWCPLLLGSLMPAMFAVGSSFRMVGMADRIIVSPEL